MLSVDIIADISLWRSGRNRPELILHWWFWLATKPRMIGLRISTGLPILPMLVTRRCRGWGSTLRGLAGRRRMTGTSIGASALPLQLLRTGQSGIVKGFGRRLAFESLRRTNPRAAGARYGVLGVGLGWKGQPRAGIRPWTVAIHMAGHAPTPGVGATFQLRCAVASPFQGRWS